jgi:hypothetical protein
MSTDWKIDWKKETLIACVEAAMKSEGLTRDDVTLKDYEEAQQRVKTLLDIAMEKQGLMELLNPDKVE